MPHAAVYVSMVMAMPLAVFVNTHVVMSLAMPVSALFCRCLSSTWGFGELGLRGARAPHARRPHQLWPH